MSCEYPIFLDMTDRLAVVVGAGTVAARKIDKLLGAGAMIRVVGREVSDRVETLRASPPGHSPLFDRRDQLEIIRDNFKPEHVAGAFLVFACTDNPDVNAEVIRAGRAAGALVNRVDSSTDCDFITPAITDRGPVRIAISTGGASPALAKFIRKALNENLPKELGLLADELARARSDVQDRVHRAEDRVSIWETLCGEQSRRMLTDMGLEAWRTWVEGVIA
ncbi:MAG: bifunctional precorrin-2 dehydrogenase/sirohydrochlorin ferrochelatase [Phycisphaerae bacterium]|nr:bifunctional precorrin-2 dehydrogenase/sirohydrochlorin ferrochelatase [Phycisphaerae bacterium]